MPSTSGSSASGLRIQPLLLLEDDNSGKHLLPSEVVLILESSPKLPDGNLDCIPLCCIFFPISFPVLSLLLPGIKSQINYLPPSVCLKVCFRRNTTKDFGMRMPLVSRPLGGALDLDDFPNC